MGQARILIVDDDPDITEVMKTVLENKGYAVDSAEDSDRGLEHLKKLRPNLIILDVMMHTTREGFIFCRKVKRNDDYKDIPVLMITSIKDKTGIDFASAAGDEEWLPVEDFLDKPVKPETLIAKVKEILEKKNGNFN